VSLKIKKTLLLVLISLLLCLLLGSPAAALAIKGFIAEDQNGSFYQYSYSELIDSYALKIIGLSNGLYEDFSSKNIYAVLDSSGQLFSYHEIVNRYASAVLLDQQFDLQGYFDQADAVRAAAPLKVSLVSITAGDINSEPKTTSTAGPAEQPEAATEAPPAKTPICGMATVTLEQAQNWARSQGAEQIFIDVATLYWDYGLLSGLRPEVLYAQAAVESDFGRSSNLISPDSNNWAGIRTATAAESNQEEFEKFPTPEEGVRAHYNHLSAYVGYSPIGEPHASYHLAASQTWAGQVVHVEDLDNRWAPSADYHFLIIQYLEQIRTIDPGVMTQVPTVDLQSPEGEQAASGQNNVSQVIVNVNILHLRSGPSTDYEILARLPLGTVLTVNGSQNEWLMVDVEAEGKSGWVHGAYVRSCQITAASLQGRKIVIDPGHGGSDPGARGTTGVQEKTINLSIAQKLVNLLEEAGAIVILTRNSDQTVINQQRVDLANKAAADLMISIHANSFSNVESNGTETFYCAKNSNNTASRMLALQVQRELVTAIGLRNRGVKTSSFFVLNKVNLPAALVEVAFLSNPLEEAILLDPEAQNKIAMALYRGIEAYFSTSY